MTRRRRQEIGLAATITFAMASASMTTFAVGALSPFIVPEFSLSRGQLGSFTAASYAIAALASVPLGKVIDAVDARRMVRAMFGLSAASLVALSLSHSYLVLLLVAVPAGVVSAIGNPVTNQLVAAHVPIKTQGIVLGVKQAGVQLGAFGAGLLPTLAAMHGWRTSVVAAAVLMSTGVIVAGRAVPGGGTRRLIADDPVAQGSDDAPATIRYLMLYALLMGGYASAVLTHMALYVHDELGLGASAAGGVVAVIAGTGVVSRLVLGYLSRRIVRVERTLFLLAGCSAVAGSVLVSTAWGPSSLIWVAAFGVGATTGAWNTVAMVAIVRNVDARSIGRASGQVNVGFFGGFVVSPVAFGVLVDYSDNYLVAWIAVLCLGIGGAVVALHWTMRTGQAGREVMFRSSARALDSDTMPCDRHQ